MDRSREDLSGSRGRALGARAASYSRWVGLLAQAVSLVAGGILVAQVLALTYSAARGILNILGLWIGAGQAVWLTETVSMSLLPLGLLSAALALRAGAHQGIDALTSRMPRRLAAAVTPFVHGIVGLFGVLFAVLGLQHVAWAMDLGGTLSSVAIPKWPFYLCYPVSGALFALFSLEKLLELHGRPAGAEPRAGSEGTE